MNAAQAYEWLAPKLSTPEREALDVISARVAELERLVPDLNHLADEMDASDKKIEDALMKQRDAAVEALVWVFEDRPGWREKVAWAVRQQPESLLNCFKR